MYTPAGWGTRLSVPTPRLRQGVRINVCILLWDGVHGLVPAEIGVRLSVYILLWDGAHGLVQAEIGVRFSVYILLWDGV